MDAWRKRVDIQRYAAATKKEETESWRHAVATFYWLEGLLETVTVLDNQAEK